MTTITSGTHQPLVSVILTSYNQAEWLEQAIESVLAQTLTDWELLLIDNGSSDDSPSIIRRYETNPQVRIIQHEQNQPHTVILNDGIRLARGRYFSLLFSDDYYLPEKLQRQVEAFEGLPDEFGVVYSGGYQLRPGGQLSIYPYRGYHGPVLEALLTQPAFFLPIAPLVLRRALLEFPFDESVFMEGEGIYSKLALRYSFHSIPDALVVMREHDRNLGKAIEPNMRRSVLLYEHLFARSDFPVCLRHLRGQAIATTYRLGGWQAIRRERRYKDGMEWLLLSAKHHKRSFLNPRVLAGIAIGWLPPAIADRLMDWLNWLFGSPPPPLDGPPLPVEGRPAARTSTRS